MYRTLNEGEAIELIAAAAHLANRAYCKGIGDDTQPTWEKAPEWQRDSAVNGVRGVLLGNSPEQSHELWMVEKLAHGWTYGLVKDTDRKIHPCLRPYAELTDAQRRKDDIFCNTVRDMARLLERECKAAV